MHSILKSIAILSTLAVTSLSPAQATSFDCAKARTFAEETICSSAPLQRLDEELNSEYVRTLGRVPNEAKAQVRQLQREWLKRRDACNTAGCLSVAMTDQTRALALWGIEGVKVRHSPIPTSSPQKNGGEHQDSGFDVNQGASTDLAEQGKSPVPHTTSNSQPISLSTASSSAYASHDMQPFKIGLVVMVALLLICIWLHSRGSMTIYQDYTDALWTTLTPVLSVGAFFLAQWLDLSDEVAGWTAVAVLVLMSLQILIQTYRSNGFSPYFLLSLYAKFALFTLYLLLMGLLLFGGNTKGDRRRRRGWAIAASALFAFFTAWMCRNRQFSHIDDYLAGRA